MKALKILTYAIVVAAGIAFGAGSVRGVTLPTLTTNDVILTISLTISTNSFKEINASNTEYTVRSKKMVNKDLLILLGSDEFANTTFSNGDQIAIAYDEPWNGHVVVVDKSGTNVLFDATSNNGSTNTLAIELRQEIGTFSLVPNYKPSGSDVFTYYDSGSFILVDTTNTTSFTTSGPSTIKFTQNYSPAKEFSTNQYSSWSVTTTFNPFGAGGQVLNANGAVVTGTIKGKGSGKGRNFFFLPPV